MSTSNTVYQVEEVIGKTVTKVISYCGFLCIHFKDCRPLLLTTSTSGTYSFIDWQIAITDPTMLKALGLDGTEKEVEEDLSGTSFELLEEFIVSWAIDRDIFLHSDSKTQCLKCVSEVGELADNVAKGKSIKDDIGDVIVTLILLAQLNELDIVQCLNHAYKEISKRTGKMVNGVFVKDN